MSEGALQKRTNLLKFKKLKTVAQYSQNSEAVRAGSVWTVTFSPVKCVSVEVTPLAYA